MSSLRILCLHGYTQNGPSFSAHIGGLRKLLRTSGKIGETNFEFEFLDGPHLATPSWMTDDWGENRRQKAKAWWNAEDANTIIDGGDEGEEEVAAKVYAGFERSFELARARISSGHIDGLFGFSQGVCFASILAKACASEL